MDNIINFLILIICLVIILINFNSEALEKFQRSANDLN